MKTWLRRIVVMFFILCFLILLLGNMSLFEGIGLKQSNASIETPPYTIYQPVILKPAVAFPGAEGFGHETLGGRGGKILEVTNLNNDGPGSLRTAIDTDGPRIVVFRVAGTIELTSALVIRKPYITIAGQTAPGGGITLKNNPINTNSALIITTHDVIVRYIRSRPGPPKTVSSNGDAIEILGAYNVMIDHCSFSWAIDEVASTWYNAHDITFQWNIISEGLDCSLHTKGCHSMGLLLGSEGSGNISVHHNLFVHNVQRNPLIQTGGVVDTVNNLIFDSGYTPIPINDGYGAISVNVVGNRYIMTPGNYEYLISPSSESGLGIKLFVQGNITPTRPSDTLDEALVVKPDARQWIVANHISAPPITTTSALDAYNQVLADSGANIGLDSLGIEYVRRDPVDIRVVNDVINLIPRRVDDPSDVGGWPTLPAGTAVKDTDKDGMPDDWEKLYNFNSSNPADGPLDTDKDGYTNIEEYLNGTNPNSQIS